jgi:hypothetical protein
MPKLRGELEKVLAELLAASEASRAIALDALGDAIGVLPVSTDEIDALMTALEAQGREILGPTGEGAEARLKRVVSAARDLKQTLPRRPTLSEVALHAQLTREQTLAALALLRVMQR